MQNIEMPEPKSFGEQLIENVSKKLGFSKDKVEK